MTSRQDAIRRLAEDTTLLPAAEPFTVRFYQPEDGYGVARLFHAVYGDGYPLDTFYLPEQLTGENRAGRIRSVVARTEDGQVVSHIAFYRSSAPNPDLYEFGLGLTLPAYRPSLAFARCTNLLLSLVEQGCIKAFFGEAVCNHTTTQKLNCQVGAVECALEPALMPAHAYTAEQSADGRVSCIMAFRADQDHRRPLCIPPVYHQQLVFLLEGTRLNRELLVADAGLATGHAIVETVRFSGAGVARCTVRKPGADLAQQVQRLEEELCRDRYTLLQCFVPLGESWAGPAVAVLRDQGFFWGGFLPIWFGNDGLLMQKLFVAPDFDRMRLHTERGRLIRDLVRADWEQASCATRNR